MRRASAVAGTILFSFVVPAAVGGWIPWLLPHASLPPAALWAWLGLVPVGFGAASYAWCAIEFARSLGTPLPGADTVQLVVRGPYRVVRNPMYLAVLCVILGWAVLLSSWAIVAYAAGFVAVVTVFVMAVEEPRLRRRFGDSYDAYRSRVGRWVPRTPRQVEPPPRLH